MKIRQKAQTHRVNYRILRILNRPNIGGPAHNATLLTRALAPEFETLLVAGSIDDTEGDASYLMKHHGVAWTTIPEMEREINWKKDRAAYKKIAKLIREYKPHIVHTHAAKSGALGRLAAANEKVPVIVHTFHGHVFHSYFSPLKTRIFIEIERYLGRKSHAIVAISDLQKKELSDTFRIAPAEKFHVVPNGYPLDHLAPEKTEKLRGPWREKWSLSQNEMVIGIVGRLVPIKNHKLFIDVFNYIREKSPVSVKAMVVGGGELKHELVNYAEQLGIRVTNETGQAHADMIFTGWDTDVASVYAGLDVVVLTSDNEGTPSSLIEAVSAGKPVLSTDVGGVKDVLGPELSQFAVPRRNTEAFALRLLEIISDPEKHKELFYAASANMRARYSEQRLVADMRRLYLQLLGGL